MENNLFRKSSLDRISSPEQLSEYIKITNPSMWVVLVGILVMLVFAAIWGFTGTIPETVSIQGISEGNTITLNISLAASKRLAVDMKAQVSPDYAPREEYGYINGRIAKIAAEPVNGLVKITVELDGNNGRPSWSNKKGEAVQLTNGSDCTVLIVTKEMKPYELVF